MENFDTEKIEQFLQGQLSPTEQKGIAERIATEPDFAEAVNLHKISMVGIERFGLQKMEEDIASLDKALEEEGFFLTADDLDAYIDKKSEGKTQQQIEQRLAKDANFKKDFDLHQLTRAGIEKKETDAAFSDLFEDLDKDLEQEGSFENLDTKKNEDKKTEQPSAKIVRFPFQRLAIAASVALAIFAGWWIFQTNPSNPQEIYATNFTPFPDQLSSELEETGFVREPYYEVLEEAMTAYQEGTKAITDKPLARTRYKEAIDLFEQYRQAAPATDDFYPTATLYLAIAHLNLENAPQAIPLLESLTQQDFSQKTAAQWYLSLSYIKNEQIEKAISILESLEQTDYEERATRIINDLQ